MSKESNLVLIVCFAILGLVTLVEGIRTRKAARFATQSALLIATGLLLRVLTGFPNFESWDRVHFGSGSNPWPMITLVFASIVIGMASRYFFYLKGPLSWANLLKPLCVSPMVLLPLLGTLQDVTKLEPIQVVSFCILAFQNGFFWRVVFERAQSSLKSQVPAS